MAGGSLFDDLPPPCQQSRSDGEPQPATAPAVRPLAVPKSAIKRTKEGEDSEQGAKRVHFETTIEATALQVEDAMQKITAHIGNRAKFGKASKLALQLLQSGSLSTQTADKFFELLKASMAVPTSATEASLRQDYQCLFAAVSEELKWFSPSQQAQLKVWLLWAQVANDFFTDDSFVFSKAANRVKQDISSLPEANELEHTSEAAVVKQCKSSHSKLCDQGAAQVAEVYANNTINTDEMDSDPFGLNALLSGPSKKDEKAIKKKEDFAVQNTLHEETRLLQERREALMACLEIAAGRYKLKWAQTIIDILVKHAFDNISKFMLQQRSAIESLWGSVREQHIRRKQGKTASGRLDVTGFERLQRQYSQAKISIRHSVGADGDRCAEQWLG